MEVYRKWLDEVSQQTGLSKRTVQLYEKEKLINPKKEENIKYYSKNDIQIIEYINTLRNKGFTLNEIKKIINVKYANIV